MGPWPPDLRVHTLAAMTVHMQDRSVLERLAAELRVNDLLVLERDAQRLRLIGGTGRGSSWAGVVDAPLDDELAARRAVRCASAESSDTPTALLAFDVNGAEADE